MKPLLFAAALFLALPAAAQQPAAFTTADAALMTACIEKLSSANQAEDDPAALRPMTDCIGAASTVCMESEDGGFSTIGMVTCTARETDWWDSQLNTQYAGLRESLAPDLFSTLQAAQRAWIDYRDKACGFEYDLWGEGSIRSVIHAGCMLDLTAARAYRVGTYAHAEP